MKTKLIHLIALVILFSCSTENEIDSNNNSEIEEINYYFKLNQNQINSPSPEGEFSINISTNTEWKISSKPDWVTITPEKGSQDVELRITLQDNVNSNSRTGVVEFNALNKVYTLNISQKIFPLSLVSYTGSDSSIKMKESKYLLFNKPVTLNSITSGDDRYSFFAGPNDIEYFEGNQGIKFTVGPSTLGNDHKYKFSVTDADGNTLQQEIELNFYTQKIIVPGAIKKIILDDQNNLWVLSLKVWESGEPSYILKFSHKNGKLKEELRFEVDVDQSNSDYVEGDFFINPYNDLIYIPDYEGEEVDVYSKNGTLVKHIQIPSIDSDHPQYPHSSPVYIGFNIYGKGIISIQGKGISGIRWRFIDSTNDDILIEPSNSHPYYYSDFKSYVLNRNKSKLYVLEDRTPVVKVFNGSETFEEISMNSLYAGGADAARITQNKLSDKIYVAGLYNQQIITPHLAYRSKQTFTKFLLGDFSYDSELENHIYALRGTGFSTNGVWLRLLDYDNQNTIFDYQINTAFSLGNNSGIVTTTDDRFVIVYSDKYDLTTSRSQIVIFDTEMFK